MTGIHISPGSSVTAADTNSSVTLLLDFPCLIQLTRFQIRFTDSLYMNQDSLIIILMAASSYFMNQSACKCQVIFTVVFFSLCKIQSDKCIHIFVNGFRNGFVRQSICVTRLLTDHRSDARSQPQQHVVRSVSALCNTLSNKTEGKIKKEIC